MSHVPFHDGAMDRAKALFRKCRQIVQSIANFACLAMRNGPVEGCLNVLIWTMLHMARFLDENMVLKNPSTTELSIPLYEGAARSVRSMN
jgi:hypothetical protein